MNYPKKIDLHIHTTVSDGTDTPEELLQKVKDAGIELFSVTDHDAVKASTIIPDLLKEGDPAFVCGAEFSCKDEEGKYHILGYDYDPSSESILKLVDMGHTYRINKVRARLDFLKDQFHFRFSDEDLKKLFAMDNPGKPHIANMMVRYGYTKTKEERPFGCSSSVCFSFSPYQIYYITKTTNLKQNMNDLYLNPLNNLFLYL